MKVMIQAKESLVITSRDKGWIKDKRENDIKGFLIQKGQNEEHFEL